MREYREINRKKFRETLEFVFLWIFSISPCSADSTKNPLVTPFITALSACFNVFWEIFMKFVFFRSILAIFPKIQYFFRLFSTTRIHLFEHFFSLIFRVPIDLKFAWISRNHAIKFMRNGWLCVFHEIRRFPALRVFHEKSTCDTLYNCAFCLLLRILRNFSIIPFFSVHFGHFSEKIAYYRAFFQFFGGLSRLFGIPLKPYYLLYNRAWVRRDYREWFRHEGGTKFFYRNFFSSKIRKFRGFFLLSMTYISTGIIFVIYDLSRKSRFFRLISRFFAFFELLFVIKITIFAARCSNFIRLTFLTAAINLDFVWCRNSHSFSKNDARKWKKTENFPFFVFLGQ